MTTKQRLGVEPIKKEGPLRPPRFDAFMPPDRAALIVANQGPGSLCVFPPIEKRGRRGARFKEVRACQTLLQTQKRLLLFVASFIDWCLVDPYAVFWRLP